MQDAPVAVRNVTMTGFKAFGDVEANPTQKIIEHFTMADDPRIAQLQVLDVSLAAVDTFFESLAVMDKQSKHLVIHLGVHQAAQQFQIEHFAYNTKDFRIPDNDGKQPENEIIDATLVLGAPCETHFPTHAIIDALKSEGLAVNFSDDPGRYVCNYTYFKSMQRFSTCSHVDTVFVHAPPEEACSIEQQIHFVNRLIEVWKGMTNQEA